MRLFKKIFLYILIFSFLPAALPGFSVFAATAHAEAAAQQNDFIIQLKTASGIFSSDPEVQSVRTLFADSTAPQFKNIFDIKTVYSQQQFLNIYGSNIIYIQPNHQMVEGAVSVNDPGFSPDPTDVDHQWGLIKGHFIDAWTKTTGSASTVVAIVDTGIDGTHEDLSSGQVGAGFNFTTNTTIPAGINSDDNGHGTLVAGVIGATPNNFRGIAGIDWNVTLMPLKALDATGSGNSADVASAIVYAADHGANIINLSLGGVGFQNDTTLSNAISYAFNKNVVIVAAAGNDTQNEGIDLDQNPVFPVCDDNNQNMIIGVAATDINDQKASFSNYGKNCVDVSAPGKRILSTINYSPTTHAPAPNGYAYASGTSLAAPFVSGEAALIKSLYPAASNIEIEDRIIKSADPIDSINLLQCASGSCAGLMGSGRINAFAALDPSFSVAFTDGTLVKPDNSSQVYLISSGQKLPVSNFVLQQRFSSTPITTVPFYELTPLTQGPYAQPLDGTIIKSPSDPTVYEMVSGFKRPITFQIWQQRGLQPSQVNIVSDQEIASWTSGTFLPPVDGTLVRDPKSPTVYLVISGLLHPMNRQFYLDRGLNHFPIMILNKNDINGYALGNAYIR